MAAGQYGTSQHSTAPHATAQRRPCPCIFAYDCQRGPQCAVVAYPFLNHRMAFGRDASERKGPQRQPQQRLGRRLEEVAEAVGGGYCR